MTKQPLLIPVTTGAEGRETVHLLIPVTTGAEGRETIYPENSTIDEPH